MRRTVVCGNDISREMSYSGCSTGILTAVFVIGVLQNDTTTITTMGEWREIAEKRGVVENGEDVGIEKTEKKVWKHEEGWRRMEKSKKRTQAVFSFHTKLVTSILRCLRLESHAEV